MTQEIAGQARSLMRRADRAVLATAHGADGWPFGSLVLLALDHDAAPLLLISALAEHSKAIAGDSRVSLLIDGTAGLANPLAGPRVTVLGRAERSALPRHRARYLARHPEAALYAGFTDFAVYRIAVTRAHFVAGFGRIAWIDAAELLFDVIGCEALSEGEADLIARLPAEQPDLLPALAPAPGWVLTGIDPEGADLRKGGEVARLDFDGPARTPAEAEVALERIADGRRPPGA